MCYAIPGRLIALKDNIGTVDYYGEERKVLMDDASIQIGDYVYAQGGIVIRKVEVEEAKKIIDAWKEKFFELKDKDKELSQNESTGSLEILQKVNKKKQLSDKELLELLAIKDKDDLSLLYQFANNKRYKEHDNASCVHGIIEFSNYCSQNCWYCGVRANRDIQRYRLSADQIVDTAKDAVDKLGFQAFVLQSGEDLVYDEQKLVEIVKRLKDLGVLVFLSIGLRSKELYQKLYDAGARAVLLRFETSNEDLFAKLRPGTTLKDRLQLISDLTDMGYIIATGFLVGLPGETPQDIINNIRLTCKLNPEMYSFGPLIPTCDTPLAKEEKIDKDLMLKIIAITRLLALDSNILVTTALETLDVQAKKEGLLAGANSLMLNITPQQFKELYTIYDNRVGVTEDLQEEIKKTVELLESLGRAPTDIGLY